MGDPAFVLFIVILIFGPFAAAWIACRIVPADRPLIAILGWGIICGLIIFLIVGFAVLKIAERRHPGGENAYILVVFITGGPLLGALAFSLLRRLGFD